MKHTLRTTFAALLAALALACVGLGDRADAAPASGGRSFQPQAQSGVATGRQALALAFLQGGAPVLAPPGMRAGVVPRVAPGAGAPDTPARGIAHAARLATADARTRCTLLPTFARRLAAARDGTVSARSTGVPPPALA
ncbi:hypothetical protein [Longimicrobium sp.]|uniref:hypothetical protein n=1 Tax=Longimicrobium sp. TaxID=2029185 RepID=UPI002E305C49|nr:hypothetical protein [Longimicrobium sp.]HEX6037386.1 hypothetical protein [Longimicrobium sp.]